jgi:hypothetical protein
MLSGLGNIANKKLLHINDPHRHHRVRNLNAGLARRVNAFSLGAARSRRDAETAETIALGRSFGHDVSYGTSEDR